MAALCAAATFSNQDRPDLDSTAKTRIEQARTSIVIIKTVDQANETVSQALGFFVRKDLVATDSTVLDTNSRLHLTAATKDRVIKVSSSGHYVLPYLLVEAQAEVSPLRLGDSERLALNDAVYMLNDAGEIAAGKITGTTTIKNNRAFLISLPVNSSNRGGPIFNAHGEVIGIAAKSLDGRSAGLAWPSDLLASLSHLGEPGVGVGAGNGPPFSVEPRVTHGDSSATPQVDTKPVRLNSPAPRYTEAARANRTQGSVILRVLVGVDGNANAVRVVRGLPDGLTEQAIATARLTKFKPAMKDGKPVEFWVVLEMNFNLR
jgi:TonB family protein